MRARLYPVVALALFYAVAGFMFVAGETRLDAYYSVFTLCFLVSTELLLPRGGRYRGRVLLVEILLLAGFFYVVALRIMEVLGWGLP